MVPGDPTHPNYRWARELVPSALDGVMIGAGIGGAVKAAGTARFVAQGGQRTARLMMHEMRVPQAKQQILFGQKSVSAFFSERGSFKSKPILEVVQGLRSGAISPESLPIEMIVRDGQKIALNNRSLLALRRAGIEPKVIVDKTGIPKYESLLNEHLQGGLPSDTINIRGGPPGTSLITPTE